jgi:hypothetical protein
VAGTAARARHGAGPSWRRWRRRPCSSDRDDDTLTKLDALSIDIRMAATAPWPNVVPSVEPGLSTLAFLLAVTAAT